MSEVIKLKSQSELNQVVESLVKKMPQKCLLLFTGEVGSGKTTLVSLLAKRFVMTAVASPSFAIHHRYENSKGESLDHVDLYRLKSEEDLESTGFWDLFSQEKGYIVVEWADQISSEAWPIYWPTYEVSFEKKQGEERIVTITKIN